MRFIRLSLPALIFTGALAWANEHAAAPAEGEGGGHAPPRDQKEYTDKTTKMNGLAAKLEEANHHFEEVVKEKEEAKTAEAKAPYLKELVEIAKQRDKDQLEYDKVKSELAQRYPNQGAHVNRHIEKHAEHGGGGEHGAEAQATEHGDHAAPADEHAKSDAHPKITAAPTLDDLLNQTKDLIDRKYAPFEPKPAPHAPRAPASVEVKVIKAPRLRLEK